MLHPPGEFLATRVSPQQRNRAWRCATIQWMAHISEVIETEIREVGGVRNSAADP